MSRQEIEKLFSQFTGAVKKAPPTPYSGQVKFGFDPAGAEIGIVPKPKKRRKTS